MARGTLSEWLGMDDQASAEEIEPVLREALERAREAHPDVEVEDEIFVRYLGERIGDPADAARSIPALCIGDLFVACGCLMDEPHALAAFEREHLPVVGRAVARIDSSPGFTDEITQQIRVNLLLPRKEGKKGLATYRGQGKLTSWVKVSAVREALEVRRKSRPQDVRSDDELAGSADLDDDPELFHIRQLYRTEFSSAFKEALADLSVRERNILRMYLLDGLNIDQIGGVYHVHRATIARWIARSRENLFEGTRSRLVDKLGITQTQFESLMGIVRSHMDLSIERLLVSKSRS